MDAIWISGAASSPTNTAYASKSPSVILPVNIAWPPMMIMTMPTMPTISVENAVTSGDAGERRGDVAEEPVDAARERLLLAALGHVRLHDSNAAHCLGQAARDFGRDRVALAEDRAKAFERDRHHDAERQQDDERDRRHLPVEVEEHAERDDRGDQAADELHEPRADEISNALGVRHHARDQDAALRRVEVADRQAEDVRLELLAHVRDGALRGDAHHLGEPEGRGGLDQRREAAAAASGYSQLTPGACR